MLTHLSDRENAPPRVLLIGAGGGFDDAVARALRVRGAHVIGLSRRDIDLSADGSAFALASELRASDHLVLTLRPASAVSGAPDRATAAIADALRQRPVAHVVSVGSTAVYPAGASPITEAVPPTDPAGAVDLARERALAAAVGRAPLALLRVSKMIGRDAGDDRYGPARFRRQARAGEPIRLIGRGDELRDYVSADDAATATARACLRKSVGTLNVASGRSISFRDLAATIAALYAAPGCYAPPPVFGPPADGRWPPPSRRYDVSALRTAFPDLVSEPLETTLERLRDADRNVAAA